MKAIIWIIILAFVVWGIWWFVHRDSTAGIPATGGQTGQAQGDSTDYVAPTDSGSYDGKG